jgi:hypothetical protein
VPGEGSEEGSGEEGPGDGDVVQDGSGEGTADDTANEDPSASEDEQDPPSEDEGASGQIPAEGLPGNNGTNSTSPTMSKRTSLVTPLPRSKDRCMSTFIVNS